MCIAALLVLALICMIAAGAMFSVGSAFYALTALSGLAFAVLVISAGLTVGAMLLLNKAALPLLQRRR